MPAVNGVGKPCAGEPHARFDGRELETAHRSHQGHGDEGHQGKPCGHQRLRDLPSMRVTAPALDPPTTTTQRSRPPILAATSQLTNLTMPSRAPSHPRARSGYSSSWWSPCSRSSWRNARHLPHGRSRAGDRHLNFYDTQDNVLSRPLLRLLWRCAWRWRDADRGCVAERPPCGMPAAGWSLMRGLRPRGRCGTCGRFPRPSGR